MRLLEIHILQTVVPCNLNRDDTNSPKDAVFGGVRRARVSSQAQKRATRLAFHGLLPEEDRAIRTKRLVDAVSKCLEDKGRPPDQVAKATETVLNAVGLGVKAGKTEYLLFLGRREIDRLADRVDQHLDALQSQEAKGKKKGELEAGLMRSIEQVFDGGKAVDVALFGRMLADRPDLGKDASVQVAHAISTHKVDREFDFYTAVDDLNPEEETGAGMMGDVEFYSATLYRYAVLDTETLMENLQRDADLAKRGALAFLRAFLLTLPTGKQNSFAAHNPPLFFALRAGEGMPRNLATAFEQPVWPRESKSLAGLSAERLMSEWRKFDQAYGSSSPEWVGLVNLTDGEIPYHADKARGDLEGVLLLAEEALAKLLNQEA